MTGRISYNEKPVLAALARPPRYHTTRQIADRLGISYMSAGSVLRRLERKRQVERIGTPLEVGIKGVHGGSSLFTLTGPKPEVEPAREIADDIRIAQPRRIGGYRYGWGEGGEA